MKKTSLFFGRASDSSFLEGEGSIELQELPLINLLRIPEKRAALIDEFKQLPPDVAFQEMITRRLLSPEFSEKSDRFPVSREDCESVADFIFQVFDVSEAEASHVIRDSFMPKKIIISVDARFGTAIDKLKNAFASMLSRSRHRYLIVDRILQNRGLPEGRPVFDALLKLCMNIRLVSVREAARALLVQVLRIEGLKEIDLKGRYISQNDNLLSHDQERDLPGIFFSIIGVAPKIESVQAINIVSSILHEPAFNDDEAVSIKISLVKYVVTLPEASVFLLPVLHEVLDHVGINPSLKRCLEDGSKLLGGSRMMGSLRP